MINTYIERKNATAAIIRHIKIATAGPLKWYITGHVIPPIESLVRLYDRWLYAVIDRCLPDEREDQNLALTQMIKMERNRYIVIGRQAGSLLMDNSNVSSKKQRGIIAPAALALSRFILHSWRYVISATSDHSLSHHSHSEIALFNFEKSIEDKLCLHIDRFWPKLQRELRHLLPGTYPIDFFLQSFARIVGWSMGALAAFLGSECDSLILKLIAEEDDDEDTPLIHPIPCPFQEHFNNIFR